MHWENYAGVCRSRKEQVSSMAKKDDDGKAAMNGAQNDKREELSAELLEQYLDRGG